MWLNHFREPTSSWVHAVLLRICDVDFRVTLVIFQEDPAPGSKITRLPNRSLVSVKGKDGGNFLQGLVTADVAELRLKGTLYSMLLNAQVNVRMWISHCNPSFLSLLWVANAARQLLHCSSGTPKCGHAIFRTLIFVLL